MKMLEIDVNEIEELTKVTQEEALEFLKEGVPIVCRIHHREFQEISKEGELHECKKLKEMGIYDIMELYIN